MRKASKCAKEAFEQIIHIQMPKEISNGDGVNGLQRRLCQPPAHDRPLHKGLYNQV